MAEEEKAPPPPYTLETAEGLLTRSRGFTGKGKATYKLDEEVIETYEGDFDDGIRQGKGSYVYKNGDKYIGGFHENLKQGLGRLTYKPPAAEEEAGEEEGEEAKPKRGGRYYGEYVQGLREGSGTFHYANGDVYSGDWKEGKKHGWGNYTFAKDQTKYEGTWANGRFQSGRWIFPTGIFYVGGYRYNKPNGEGVFVFLNGNQLVGDYTQTLEAVEAEEGKEVKEEPGEGEEGVRAAPVKEPKVLGVQWVSREATVVRSARLSAR